MRGPRLGGTGVSFAPPRFQPLTPASAAAAADPAAADPQDPYRILQQRQSISAWALWSWDVHSEEKICRVDPRTCVEPISVGSENNRWAAICVQLYFPSLCKPCLRLRSGRPPAARAGLSSVCRSLSVSLRFCSVAIHNREWLLDALCRCRASRR